MYDLSIQNPNFRPIEKSRFDVPSDLPHVIIYSDGSYKPAIDYGGYGTLMECRDHRMMIYGGSTADSNNRMELTAVLAALRRLNRPCDVTVVSDSQYVINGLNGYIWNWCNNNWQNAKGQQIANVDLWQEMLNFCMIHRIHGNWIKGHAGHESNELCDRLATLGAYHSANQSVPWPHTLPRDLSKGKFPGHEDDDTLVNYEIPYGKLRHF